MGPVDVEMAADERLHTGQFQIVGRMVEGAGAPAPDRSCCPRATGSPSPRRVITIGRHPDSNMVLADANVSRNHAEIRPQGDKYVVVDLGSTNGSRVNGVRVDTQVLEDGDELTFGNTRMRFEAS